MNFTQLTVLLIAKHLSAQRKRQLKIANVVAHFSTTGIGYTNELMECSRKLGIRYLTVIFGDTEKLYNNIVA